MYIFWTVAVSVARLCASLHLGLLGRPFSAASEASLSAPMLPRTSCSAPPFFKVFLALLLFFGVVQVGRYPLNDNVVSG